MDDFIYVLLLDNNKYYIGKTKNFAQEVETRFEKDKCEWTQNHKLVRIFELYFSYNKKDDIIAQYIQQKGVDNVRCWKFI